MVNDDLVAFLRARLDEDEAAAETWREHDLRPLREVEAKRAILADYERALNFEVGFNDGDQPRRVLEMALRYLAAVYRDHPDYGWTAKKSVN